MSGIFIFTTSLLIKAPVKACDQEKGRILPLNEIYMILSF